MATVLHDIKIGYCMLPTLTIFNWKSILVDSACMIGDVTPEATTGFFETLCS